MKIYRITISNLSGKKKKTGGDIWKVNTIWVTGRRRMKKIVEAIKGIKKGVFIDVIQVKKETECNDKWVEKYTL